MMMVYHVYAITLAFFLDLLIGDPPKWPHPVKWIGMLIGRLEKKLNTGAHKKGNGILMLLLVLLACIRDNDGQLHILLIGFILLLEWLSKPY